jgi:hypothetical protein
VLYSGLLGFLLLMLQRERRMKKLQNALLDELLPGLTPHQRWFRINLARQPFFSRRMRAFGFEAKGLLIDQGELLRILAVRPNGERLERVVPKAPASVRWRGNAALASANLHWLELGNGLDTVMVAADTGVNAVASREATADLMRALLPQHPLDALALADFALEKHPLALAAVVAAVVLLIGGLVDLAVSEHQLLQPRSLQLVGMLGLPMGLSLYPLLARRKVPSRESMALSFLMAVALSIAIPGAALRLDQKLSGGPVATPYRLVHGGLLQPVEPGPPEVLLSNVREYWAQFEPGSIHQLDIVHGPLGLWQLDRSRLNGITREWYEREDGVKPPGGNSASAASVPAR